MTYKVNMFEYDIEPTEDGEIITAFKVDGKYCEMKIPEKTIKDMLFWVTKDKMCEDCKQNEKNSGLDVCGGCYSKRIWGNRK